MLIVSIILPTYKNPMHINRVINSVLEQSFVDWELIIINDGLAEETKQVIINYQKNDPRIILISNLGNLGIQRSLNKGLAVARGKYIARIDDDDWWINKDKLRRQVEFLDTNPDYVLLGTDAVICNEKLIDMQNYVMPKHDIEIRNRILFKNCFIHSTVLMRKTALDKAGGYQECRKVRNVEDYHLWLELGLMGKMANINMESTRLIVSNSSITAKNRLRQAFRDIMLTINYRKKYSHFLFAFFTGCLRFVFFVFNSIFPLPKKVLYKIQAMYKAI